MTVKVTAHIQEQPESQPAARVFTAWTTVSSIDEQRHVSGSTRKGLTSSQAIAYAVEIERQAWQDGVKFERAQYLIY